MRTNYDDSYGSHFGIARTVELICCKYFWPAIMVNIKKYVHDYNICQRAKAPRYKPYKELQSLSILKRPWKSISIDMIMGLLPSVNSNLKVFDAIFVVVDCFTKMAKCFLIQKTTNAAEFTHLFHKEIV